MCSPRTLLQNLVEEHLSDSICNKISEYLTSQMISLNPETGFLKCLLELMNSCKEIIIKYMVTSKDDISLIDIWQKAINILLNIESKLDKLIMSDSCGAKSEEYLITTKYILCVYTICFEFKRLKAIECERSVKSVIKVRNKIQECRINIENILGIIETIKKPTGLATLLENGTKKILNSLLDIKAFKEVCNFFKNSSLKIFIEEDTLKSFEEKCCSGSKEDRSQVIVTQNESTLPSLIASATESTRSPKQKNIKKKVSKRSIKKVLVSKANIKMNKKNLKKTKSSILNIRTAGHRCNKEIYETDILENSKSKNEETTISRDTHPEDYNITSDDAADFTLEEANKLFYQGLFGSD